MKDLRKLLQSLETLRKEEKFFIVKAGRIKNKLDNTRKEIKRLEDNLKKMGVL